MLAFILKVTSILSDLMQLNALDDQTYWCNFKQPIEYEKLGDCFIFEHLIISVLSY